MRFTSHAHRLSDHILQAIRLCQMVWVRDSVGRTWGDNETQWWTSYPFRYVAQTLNFLQVSPHSQKGPTAPFQMVKLNVCIHITRPVFKNQTEIGTKIEKTRSIIQFERLTELGTSIHMSCSWDSNRVTEISLHEGVAYTQLPCPHTSSSVLISTDDHVVEPSACFISVTLPQSKRNDNCGRSGTLITETWRWPLFYELRCGDCTT